MLQKHKIQKDWVSVAKIGRPVGVKGEVLLHLLTDFPEVLKVGDTYFSQIGDLTIQYYNKENSRIKFTQINSREIAKQFTNLILYTTQDFTKEHCKLKEDEFFWFEIIGSKILELGEILGEVCEIERFGQKDFLSIKTSHDLQAKGFPKSFLVPYEKRYIKEVDIHTTPKIIHTNFCKEILENS
ncbi:ribosome maturation factor RimM [Helicobacter pullorum]|uniref:ribosome maturation factor RimM n=1 Tax=Helicobacter pullorum TaxID=35818 RepID=UPI001064D544|nr:ribosome maturation factor RimM [Helicobacter pullorum]